MALQSLAAFEKHQPRRPLSVNIGVKAKNLKENLLVNDDNRLLQQKTMLPELPTNASTNLEGDGCVLSQVNIFFILQF